MYECYIMCRSITYARKTEHLLKSSGIPAKVVKAPAELVNGDCGSAVKINGGQMKQAADVIGRAGIGPVKIYVSQGSGKGYREAGKINDIS